MFWLDIIKIFTTRLLTYVIKGFFCIIKKFSIDPIKGLATLLLAIILLVVIYIGVHVKPIMFKHKNKEFDNIKSFQAVENEINLVLRNLGHGTTISKAVFGRKFYNDKWVSLSFSLVRACDERAVKFRSGNGCDHNVKWRYLVYQIDHFIDIETMNFFEQGLIPFGIDDVRDFRDMQPICVNIFDKKKKLSDGTFELTEDGRILRHIAPDHFKILKKLEESVNRLCFVQVKDPIYTEIVYLFTLSFWGNKKRDAVDYKNAREYLKNIARSEKRQLTKDVTY